MEINKSVVATVGVVFLIILTFLSVGQVSAGEVGVKTQFGKVVGEVGQGIYAKLPLIETVHKIDVKTRTVNYDKAGDTGNEKDQSTMLLGASKDLQDVAIGEVVNYHIDPKSASMIFAQYSSTENYEMNVIEPIIRETVKTFAAQYTAEELVTKRTEFSDKVNGALGDKLMSKGAILERSSVTDLQFSTAFTQAIEKKATAVQDAEAAKNKLVQVQFEAQQKIETAKAEAEAIRIQAQAINSQGGADYVAMKAVEKWNGILPVQMIPGSSVPFINLK